MAFIGHNIISFDVPVLNKLWGTEIDFDACVDTLVLSYLYNPAIADGHSLAAWGRRLKFPKSEFNDWSQYSPEMEEYCRNDVELTFKVYKALSEKMRNLGYSNLSCNIEHDIRVIIDQQQINGFWFDRERATSFRDHLRELQSGLTREIQTLFPPVRTEVENFKFRTTKDGRPTASYQRHLEKFKEVVLNDDGTYSCFDDIPFNIGSPKQRVERLQSLGWKPEKFTDTGFPKVDEDALMKFAEVSGRPEVQAMSEWLVLQGRASMIDTWLNNLGSDSRIHGRVQTCGATTRRMLHSSPNTANIPSAHKAKYGRECRSFWGVEPGKGLIEVGVDASGLENVGLLHYLPSRFREKAISVLGQKKPNDVHSLNARKLSEILGREIDREWGSKTSFYATLYGAYPPKLAQIVNGTKEEGKVIQEIIIDSIPGFGELLNDVHNEWETASGRLVCIDGGLIICPSRSAALNYRIQSMGGIVMKLACIILHQEAKKQNLWFNLLGTIHDEWQMETKEEDGERLGKLAVFSIEEAAKQLNFNLPLSGEYKLGYSWADCH